MGEGQGNALQDRVADFLARHWRPVLVTVWLAYAIFILFDRSGFT